ncbi:FHA domain-containing protein [Nocardioides pelophilus]|uniref:FHA domain-containing protein n=1 Tax=Nocardioides pelophilus TaxID=2172019 RepID=UPI001602FD41|nr:FHA domain-containing protein [Nocardioides pelophilus]
MTTPEVLYVAGNHPAIVWSGGVVVLAAGIEAAVASATWERLRALPTPTTVGAVLTEIGEATGSRLLDLPPFAIAVFSGPEEAHLAVRGSFEIVATGDDGAATTVSGQDVATWTERRLTTVTTLRFGRADEHPDGEQMPIESGVVGVAAVRVHLAQTTHAGVSQAAVAAMLGEPEPEPEPELEPEPGSESEPEAAKASDEPGNRDVPDVAVESEPEADPNPAASEPAGTAELDAAPEADAPEVDVEPEDAEPELKDGSEAAAGEPIDLPAPAGDGFDDIWADHTVAGSVEGAAVRPDATPAVEAPVESRPAPPSEVTWLEDEDQDEDQDEAGEAEPAESAEAEEPSSAPSAAGSDQADGKPPTLNLPPDFISAVPGMAEAPNPAARPPALAAPPVASPPSSQPASQLAPSVGLGDHDGHTIAALPDPSPPGPVAAPGADGGVLAVLCTAGHANPPQRAQCRVCGSGLNASPTRIAQPALGRVLVSTGERADLDGPVIIGRAPRASRFQGTAIPRLMTLQHPHVSASHVALRVEGWSLLAVDLNSTNGTFLRRNGEPPFRLLEKPHLLVPGDVIDLGHGVHLRFEELP